MAEPPVIIHAASVAMHISPFYLQKVYHFHTQKTTGFLLKSDGFKVAGIGFEPMTFGL